MNWKKWLTRETSPKTACCLLMGLAIFMFGCVFVVTTLNELGIRTLSPNEIPYIAISIAFVLSFASFEYTDWQLSERKRMESKL